MDMPEAAQPEPAATAGSDSTTGHDAAGLEVRSREERIWALVAHAGNLVAWLGAGGGVANFLVPLAVWHARPAKSSWVRACATEALNFQLTMLACWVIAYLLVFLTFGVLAFVFVGLGVVNAFFSIVGGIRAWEGEFYRYPVSFRFLR
jgi:uncharacterized Tic20 family protein